MGNEIGASEVHFLLDHFEERSRNRNRRTEKKHVVHLFFGRAWPDRVVVDSLLPLKKMAKQLHSEVGVTCTAVRSKNDYLLEWLIILYPPWNL